MSENTNECVIEWIPGRDYVGVTAKNGSSWKNRCEELEKEFPDDVKILARNNDGSIFAHLPYSYIKINPPRKYSDEAKKKAAERLNKMRAEKSNTAEENPFCLLITVRGNIMRGNLLEMIFTDFLSSILRNTDTCLLTKKLWMEQTLQSVQSRDICGNWRWIL